MRKSAAGRQCLMMASVFTVNKSAYAKTALGLYRRLCRSPAKLRYPSQQQRDSANHQIDEDLIREVTRSTVQFVHGDSHAEPVCQAPHPHHG